jgi:hypothetical protein
MSDKSELLTQLAEEYEIQRRARLKKKQSESMLEHIYDVLMGEVVVGNDNDF